MEQINVNLIPSGLPPVCHASQYDKGRVIKCNLFEGNTPYLIADGDDITLNARKPDGTIIEGLSPLAIQTGVSYVYITTTEQLCACVGDTLCELRIENSADIGTLNFILRVEADVLADGIPSQSVIKDLSQLVEDAVEDLGVAVIDDTTIAVDKTWSSDKIDSLTYDFLIEYDSVTEEFNAGANEILHNLGKGYNIQFRTDATADDFVYILSDIYDYGGDDITLFFNKLIITDNGAGNKPSSILSQAVIVVDAGAETVAFAGFLEQDEIQSTDDSHVTRFNTWSAKKVDETIKAAKYSILPTDTASGAVANFPDGADDVPVKSLVANIDYDSNGYTGLTIYKTGTNLWDEQWEIGGIDSQTGQKIDRNDQIRSANYIPVVGGKTYYIKSSTKTLGIRFYDKNKNYFSFMSIIDGSINFANNVSFIRFILASTTTYNNDVSINYPSTDTEYHAYTGTTYDVDWTTEAGTVYGGSVDIANGVVTSTKAQDGSDLPDPVVTQISPTELSTLYGTNNIWADTGDVTVEYRADVQLYIDKKITEAVGGITEPPDPTRL